MFDINRCIFTGRIGNDLELKTTAGGASVCSFRLAVDRPKKKDSNVQETDWLDVIAWRQEAEFMCRYLGKGRKVIVDCCCRSRTWKDNDGADRRSIEFHVQHIQPADSRGGEFNVTE